MNPVFEVQRVSVVLHPLDMVSVAFDPLGERVGSLADDGQAIADALDDLLSRSWGLGSALGLPLNRPVVEILRRAAT